MRKKIKCLQLVLWTFFLIMIFILFLKNTEAKIIYVDNNGESDFDKIQVAIDYAEPEDTVYVSNGEYQESLVINKSLSLIGKHDAVSLWNSKNKIEPNGIGIHVISDNVTITGFDIYYPTGIFVEKSDNCFLSFNDFYFNNNAIKILYSNYSQVKRNYFRETTKGILLEKSMNCDIFNNSGINNEQLICCYNSDYNNIYNNYHEGGNTGIYLKESSNNQINNNTLLKSLQGIYLMNSKNNKIIGNKLYDNDKDIYLRHSPKNTVENNSGLVTIDNSENDWELPFSMLLIEIAAAIFSGLIVLIFILSKKSGVKKEIVDSLPIQETKTSSQVDEKEFVTKHEIGKPIEMKNWNIQANNDTIEILKGDLKVTILLEDIESCLWTSKPRYSHTFLKTGVILIFAFGIGFILVAIYYLFNNAGLDIQTKYGNYIILDDKVRLSKIKKEINSFRISHGKIKAVEADKIIDMEDDSIYDLVDNVCEDKTESSYYEDFKACINCGSLKLKTVSVSDGGIPGTFEVQGQVVCKKCGFVGMPLLFSTKEEYEKYLKESGKVKS